MLLNELFEQESKHVTFCFGRMNPPTIGHEQVFKTMAEQGGDYKIFVSQSQDKKDNPLSYSDKIKFIKAIHPQYADAVEENSALNTVVKVASHLYDLGYRNATFVAGSDRLDSFKKLLTQYNGVEGKAHGYYKFDVLDFVSAGERDPDSEGVSGVSASKARAAAANNDLAAFKEATGAGEIANKMFAAVRQGMGISEGFEFPASSVAMAKQRATVNQPVSTSADKVKTFSLEGYTVKFKPDVVEIYYGPDLVYSKSGNYANPTRLQLSSIRRTVTHLANKKKQGVVEGYGRYYCSTDKKWKTRKGPKQKRSS
jgi:hypothetical protein